MSRWLPQSARSRHPATAAALSAAAVTAAVLAAAVAADAAAASTILKLSVEQRPHHPTQVRLVARIVEGGANRAGKPVAFFVVSTEFGRAHNVPIGTAAIGAHGTARIVYTPTWSGIQRFVARLAGARVATSDYRVTASVPGPLSARANPGRPLASVGGVFLDAILTVVALVWLSLIAVLVLAIARLPRLAGGGID